VKRSPRPAAHRQRGFSMIEVLIAILVLGFGLLGFALLQTTNVRFVQSANYRTQATNLSYELLDQIRMNRVTAARYVGDYAATTEDCDPPTGAGITEADFLADWQCRLGKALGSEASATVAQEDGVTTVSVSWGDERWNEDAEDTTFTASTRL